MPEQLTRREMLGVAVAAAGSLGTYECAQGSGPLLAATTGLEHLGFTVPDTRAEFYGRIVELKPA